MSNFISTKKLLQLPLVGKALAFDPEAKGMCLARGEAALGEELPFERDAGQVRGQISWSAHASTSAQKRSGGMPGAFLKRAATAVVATNRWRRQGVSSPTGTPLRVMMKDSP